jgi:hypothetical protein
MQIMPPPKRTRNTQYSANSFDPLLHHLTTQPFVEYLTPTYSFDVRQRMMEQIELAASILFDVSPSQYISTGEAISKAGITDVEKVQVGSNWLGARVRLALAALRAVRRETAEVRNCNQRDPVLVSDLGPVGVLEFS